MPGVNTPLAFANTRAAADRAGRTVDHVVDEVHAAFVIEVLLVDQLESHLNAGVAAGDILSAVFGKALVAQIRGLIEGEFEIDRVGAKRWLRAASCCRSCRR